MPGATISTTATRFSGCGKVPNAAALLTCSRATKSGNCWRRWSRGSESWSCWMWHGTATERTFRSQVEGRRFQQSTTLGHSLDRAAGRGALQNGGFTETRAASRSSDQVPAQLESQNALSNTGELGVRQSPESRKETILGTTASSSSHPSRREKAGHHEADWVAYLSQNVLHIAAGYRCRTQSHAGTDAAFDDPRHSRHLHPGRDHRKARCANRCGIAFRHQ